MNTKIIYLILILVCVTLLSSFVSYEHFTSIFKIRFNNEDGYKMEDKFPKQNLSLDGDGKLCIQILNNTSNDNKDDIIVWLDDLPFCDKWIQEDDEGNLKNPITRGINENNGQLEKNCGFYTGNSDGNDWEKYISDMEKRHKNNDIDKIPRFMIINNDGSVDWDSKKRKEYIGDERRTIKRFFKLKTLQVLRIIPPHKYQNKYDFEKHTEENMGYVPYMCMLQYTNADIHAGNRGISFGEFDHTPLAMRDTNGAYKNCGGAGIYITDKLDLSKSGENISTQSISRIEYNINNGEIYFNFSAVDGSNMNYDAKYDLSDGDTGSDTVSPADLERFCKITDIGCTTTKISEIQNLDSVNGNENVYKNLDKYLYYTNGSPYIKSIPALKGFTHKCGNLYYKPLTSNTCSANDPDNDYKCISPIEFSDSNNGDGNTYSNDWTYWEKAIFNLKIYKKTITTDTTDTTDLYEFNGSDLTSYNASNQKDGVIPDNIHTGIKNLIFNLNEMPDTGLDKNDQITINDKNCSDASYGYGLNKGICHIWWGLSSNKCAKDYTDLIRNRQPGGEMGCTQYTWAYGEMGYDLATDQLKKILDSSTANARTLYLSYDGNPQKYPYCNESTDRCAMASLVDENLEMCRQACNGKELNDIPENNNLESLNKPLLNCQIPNKGLDPDKVKYTDLKISPVNINISIDYLERGKLELKPEDLNACKETDDGSDCRTFKQEQANGECSDTTIETQDVCERGGGTWTSQPSSYLDMNCLMAGTKLDGSYAPKTCTSVSKNDCLKGLLDTQPGNKIWCGDI